jgi:hypothetical protein
LCHGISIIKLGNAVSKIESFWQKKGIYEVIVADGGWEWVCYFLSNEKNYKEFYGCKKACNYSAKKILACNRFFSMFG